MSLWIHLDEFGQWNRDDKIVAMISWGLNLSFKKKRVNRRYDLIWTNLVSEIKMTKSSPWIHLDGFSQLNRRDKIVAMNSIGLNLWALRHVKIVAMNSWGLNLSVKKKRVNRLNDLIWTNLVSEIEMTKSSPWFHED